MSKILLVEDDPVLGKGLQVNLQLEGYEVDWVQSLRGAFEVNATKSFNLVILDMGLPDGKGLTFLQSIREAGSRMPVLILTAQTDEESVVAGLNSGASDYVRKPFGGRELLARIKNILREPTLREDQLRFGNLLILRAQRKVMFDESEVDFNRREFDILTFLVEHGDSVVSRERLLSMLDKDGEIFDRTLDSHVSHIRAKLRKSGVSAIQISSVYGVGYRLEKH